ncbi:MAG TPA: phosphoribosylanthranilate isomerase [Steroidobacteraceae bacterium]|nr:phosphoribosylanthranilate isomerase [Steroidobacteraceae bacterium]
MTRADAVCAALAAGVDAIGFVFAASVRRVQPAEAAALAAPARGRCALVAVTLHPGQPLVDEILRVLAPDILQSDASDLAALRLPTALARLPVLRAVATAGVDGGPPPARLLYESGTSGSGMRADWSQAAALARGRELILAGGLTPHNVAEAIGRVRPFGVDVSSGVETAPGRKDPVLIGEFVQAARTSALREGL